MKTISDILPFFLSELQVFYPENEIKSLAYISIKHILNMSKSDTIIHSKKILEEDQILRIKSSIYSTKTEIHPQFKTLYLSLKFLMI